MDKKFAQFFKLQCLGGYSGHMAEIKFNPIISAILEPMVHDVQWRGTFHKTDDQKFADALREIANSLDPEEI